MSEATTATVQKYLTNISPERAELFAELLEHTEGLFSVPSDAREWAHISVGDMMAPTHWAARNELHVIDLDVSWGENTGSDLDRANYLALIETFGEDKFLKTRDIYDCQGLSIVATEDNGWTNDELNYLVEIFDARSVYPLIDEEIHSNLQMEAAEEAWGEFLAYDVRRDLEDLGISVDESDVHVDEIRSVYLGFEGNEWSFETATSIVNGRHEEAVQHVADRLFPVAA